MSLWGIDDIKKWVYKLTYKDKDKNNKFEIFKANY